MNCKKIAVMLSAYTDAELSQEEIKIVDTHLEKCSQCQEKSARIKRINEELSYEEKYNLKPYFESRLFNRIQKKENSEFVFKDFIAVEKRVIFTGLAVSLVLSMFVFTNVLTNEVDAYNEIQSYIYENESNSLSKHLASKSEITTDDIVSLVADK